MQEGPLWFLCIRPLTLLVWMRKGEIGLKLELALGELTRMSAMEEEPLFLRCGRPKSIAAMGVNLDANAARILLFIMAEMEGDCIKLMGGRVYLKKYVKLRGWRGPGNQKLCIPDGMVGVTYFELLFLRSTRNVELALWPSC